MDFKNIEVDFLPLTYVAMVMRYVWKYVDKKKGTELALYYWNKKKT